MPRKSTARPRSGVGPFIVRNRQGHAKGRTHISFHVCDPSMKNERDPGQHVGVCAEHHWFEGDVFTPPEGFPLERFLRHEPYPGRTCGDDSHENCAGPYLEEVSADG